MMCVIFCVCPHHSITSVLHKHNKTYLHVGVFQMLVHPVAKSVRLDLHPQILVAANVHAFGGGALRTARNQASMCDFLQLGGAVRIVLQEASVRDACILDVFDVHCDIWVCVCVRACCVTFVGCVVYPLPEQMFIKLR